MTAAIMWLLLCGCGPASPPAFEVPIFFTCDTRGRLEPCGCFTGQYGGLTRLKTVLDAEAPAAAVRVDIGDAIGGREDYDLLQYRYLLRAFAAMKYDALNLGQREAQLSAAQLRELKRSSPVPLLSANLLDQASRKPIFEAYRIVQRGGWRVALIGVLDPRGLGEDLGAGLVVDDMESTLARRVAEVRPKADLIVLLAFTDEATLARLAEQFYEIQVILGGKVSQPAQELKRENRSLIYFVTNESRALGLLRLQLRAGAPLRVTANEIRLLHDQIPQDPSLRRLAQAYRDEVRRTPLAADDPANAAADTVPGVRTAASFVGSPRCVDCHQSAGALWAKSGHARAFATLSDRKADADPKCIGCHTTGFGAASGYRRPFGPDKLVDVGCESCHGPGSLHVRQREGDKSINFTYRPLDAGDCKKCHYGEFSRPFYWYEFWPVIKHGKEPPPPEAEIRGPKAASAQNPLLGAGRAGAAAHPCLAATLLQTPHPGRGAL
ncbi:MAG: multiheme c-type cytochrome [Verrucomicrobiota bacterium]